MRTQTAINIKTNIRLICYLGIGIALYVALGSVMNIPLLANTHLQTDLGYIAFGIYCYYFGWPAFIVGTIGCMFESLIFSGWIPTGWMLGQAFIGITCGIVFTKVRFKPVHIIVAIVSVFIGIGFIKTLIECAMYNIPFAVKFPKNCIAFAADVVPMLLGLFIGYILMKRNIKVKRIGK